MNISIFGLGYVGCVSLGCLAKNGFTVVGVDVNNDKVDQINNGVATIVENEIDEIISTSLKNNRIKATTNVEEAVLQTDISIICVGTPSTEKGHLNLDYIYKVAESIGAALKSKNSYHIIAIRSTILPGTCEKVSRIIEMASGKKEGTDFDIVDNPEFLREGTAVHDYFNPPLTLLGSQSEKALTIMEQLYSSINAPVVKVDVRTAEIMKYINNTFHALKISFANEVGNICSELNIDSRKVMEILCMDRQLNISPYYLKPGFAYGGSCLPKDLGGLQTLAHDLYIDIPLIESINSTNQIQIQRAIKKLSKFYGKRILFLGISFKAGTDDLRNSPHVELVENLLGRGFDIVIYDKNINIARLTGKNLDFISSKIPHLTDLLQTGDLLEIIHSSDVIVVSNKETYFEEALEKVNNKVIIDMVGLNHTIQSKNNYLGINW
jgi:GDP-mannose 6-dehydrogenase